MQAVGMNPNEAVLPQVSSTISNAINSVSESIQGSAREASKEGNKEIAKDSNVGLGDRISAGVDALGDKAKQSEHEAKSEAYKN